MTQQIQGLLTFVSVGKGQAKTYLPKKGTANLLSPTRVINRRSSAAVPDFIAEKAVDCAFDQRQQMQSILRRRSGTDSKSAYQIRARYRNVL